MFRARNTALFQLDGEHLRSVAHFGEGFTEPPTGGTSLAPTSIPGRAMHDRAPFQVDDVQALDPSLYPAAWKRGARTMLALPLVREDAAIGSLVIDRGEVRP